MSDRTAPGYPSSPAAIQRVAGGARLPDGGQGRDGLCLVPFRHMPQCRRRLGKRHGQAAGRQADALAQVDADADGVGAVTLHRDAVAKLCHEAAVHGPAGRLRVRQRRG